MTKSVRILPLVALLALGACGAVELPRENFWRLSVQGPEQTDAPRIGALRVADMQLGALAEPERVEVARADDVPERGGLAVRVGGVEIGVFLARYLATGLGLAYVVRSIRDQRIDAALEDSSA